MENQNQLQRQTSIQIELTNNSATSLKILNEIELRKDATVADIRKYQTPPISSLVKKENGMVSKKECYALIKGMILLLHKFLGVSWDGFQLDEVAKEFYGRYFYWHQLDLKKFVSMCRNMEFEKLLSVNQFSPIMFLEWASRYDSQWLNVSQEMYMLEHDRHKYDAAQETRIYQNEVRLRVDEKGKDERIEKMQDIIEMQKRKLKEQENGE